MERRDFLVRSTGVTALGLGVVSGASPANAQNVTFWKNAVFDTKSFADAAKMLGATSPPIESKELILQAPEIAENGSVVRVSALSHLPNTTQISFVVEKNPSAVAAIFDIPKDTDANVATNIKMGQSSNVYALAKVGDKYFYAVKVVKVTLGGCGG